MARLLLVRHARAGERGYGAADLDRPLDARGEVQARALVDLLRPMLTTVDDDVDVRSSPARRCIATVTPLAAVLCTEVVVDDGLLEGADVGALLERIATLRGTSVWSSHGDVIPELLMLLARRGVDLGEDPRCRKGSTWVLDIVDGAVASARYLPPPG